MEIEIINSSEESSFLVVSSLIVVDFSVSKKKKRGENTRAIVFRVITKATVILALVHVGLDGGFVQGA